MRLLLPILSVLIVGPAFAQTDPLMAPAPAQLLAQVDDSDLKDEESLETLQSIEYEKKKWSVGKAIALSFVPGAGYGLAYAEKGAQSTVPFILSAIGYGLGAAYLLGVFDEAATDSTCEYVPDSIRVPFEECGIGDTAGENQAVDPRSSTGAKYFETKADYRRIPGADGFDGFDVGVIILVSTYVGTTILGAAWSGAVVSDHNDQLKKDIESTVKVEPRLGYNGESGFLGVGLEF